MAKSNKEKIGLAIFIIIAFSFTVWGAWRTLNSGPDISKELKNYGIGAIEVTDNYIDGHLDADKACGKLKAIESAVEEDVSLSIRVYLIYLNIESSERDYSTDTMLDVRKARNDLADYLNIKKRK
jgi:hypothetical protein